MFKLHDITYMNSAIDEVDEYIGETATLFILSSSSGTPSSLEPATMSYGSSEMTAHISRISAREVNESGGIYESDDLVAYSSGSYSQKDRIIYRSGTYNVIEKLTPITIDDVDVRWRGVLRRG